MKVSTRQDMVAAALAIANSTLLPADIEFSEYITDTVKVVSDGWDGAQNIDYKTSELILSVQKDILGIYNSIFNTDISLKNLDKNEFLIVKFSIENGCIKYISKIGKKILESIFDEIPDIVGIFDGMTAKQKIVMALLLVAFAGAWKSPDIIRAIRENPSISAIFDSNDKVIDAVSKNQRTPVTIINNLGDGYVIYDGNKSYKDEYENGLVKPAKLDIIPVLIDDEFLILQYDFKNQKVQLFKHGEDPFWASTEWLGQDERERLKESTSAAITQQTVTRQFINMACKMKNGKVYSATVEGIGHPSRPGATNFATAIRERKSKDSRLEQGSLLN